MVAARRKKRRNKLWNVEDRRRLGVYCFRLRDVVAVGKVFQEVICRQRKSRSRGGGGSDKTEKLEAKVLFVGKGTVVYAINGFFLRGKEVSTVLLYFFPLDI